jgi:kynurenine 3-monooxygenase
VGAGLVGCSMALLLEKRGYKVDIFEKLPQFDDNMGKEEVSTNLVLATRAINVLKSLKMDNLLQSAV